ncbi:carboxymuconolactone decarboxylase family protein [Myxococcota bacterium]|nr:carboxymuconolactone decarboxylase family protein [Myxococcota bacterium]
MTSITVPTRDQVSPENQEIFGALEKNLGFVPNLYATFAHSRTALASYLAFQNAKSSLSARARETINLAVSEVNSCEYCLAAHTALGKRVGFSDEQILELRRGGASWDGKLDSLARLTRGLVLERGHVAPALVDAFLEAGWTRENLIDAIVVVGDKTVSNYLHSATRVPVDFPAAPPLG